MARAPSPRLLLLVAGLLFSTGGAAIKACSFSGWQVASMRSLVAAVTILLLIPSSRRGWNGRVLLVALCYGTTLTLFVAANKLTTAANTIFLQSTAPLYVLLLSPLLLGERIRRNDVFVLLVLLGGVMCFVFAHDDPSATAPEPSSGNILAAASGVSWALTLMGLRWLSKSGVQGAAAAATGLGSIVSFAMALALALPMEGGSTGDWLVVLYLGVFQVGLAYWCLVHGMEHVRAMEATLLLMVEPAFSPVWAWLLHEEVPSQLALLGGGTILGGLLLQARLSRT